MKKRTATLDRVMVFLLGLLLLLGGIWTIGLYLDVPAAQRLADFIDFPAWRTAQQERWFDALLAGILAVSALIGVWLISVNLRRYRIGRMSSPASGPDGYIDINLAMLAEGVAAEIGRHPRVDTVQHQVREMWGRPTMTWTVRARRGSMSPRYAASSRTPNGTSGPPCPASTWTPSTASTSTPSRPDPPRRGSTRPPRAP